jgi:hypothetical protein
LPNTLAHLGVQGFLQGSLGRAARAEIDPKWIALGCVLPDVPWIWQRALRSLFAALGMLDPSAPLDALYDLRLYAIVQGSLFLCAILALGAASLAPRPGVVFGVLAFGAALHLLLDALETKWGNGVHFFAPFAWRELNFGWFWPESGAALGLTGLGVAWVAATWRSAVTTPPRLELRGARIPTAGACLAAYLLLPILFLGAAEAGNSHSIDVLREPPAARVGRTVELHRSFYLHRGGVPVVRTLIEEELEVPGLELEDGARVSVRGRFVAPHRLAVDEWHTHRSTRRDVATYVGLVAVAAAWLFAALRARRLGRAQPQGSNSSPPPRVASR